MHAGVEPAFAMEKPPFVDDGDPLYRELEKLSWLEPTQQGRRPSIAW